MEIQTDDCEKSFSSIENSTMLPDPTFVNIDPHALHLGKYSDDFSLKSLSKSYVLFRSIEGFDDSSVDKFIGFLRSVHSKLDPLSEETRVAFLIELWHIAYTVPGEAAVPYGDEKVISFASTLLDQKK